MMEKISLNSPFTIAVLVPVVAGMWGIYSFLSPSFAMVKTNNIEIKSNKESIDKIEKSQDKYDEHIYEIANALSEIKGQLKVMNDRRRRSDDEDK